MSANTVQVCPKNSSFERKRQFGCDPEGKIAGYQLLICEVPMSKPCHEKFSSSLEPMTLRKLRMLAVASDSTLSNLLEKGARIVIEQHLQGGGHTSELLQTLERVGG